MTPLLGFEGCAVSIGCVLLSSLSVWRRWYVWGGYILLSNAVKGQFWLEKSTEVSGWLWRSGGPVGALTTCFGWLWSLFPPYILFSMAEVCTREGWWRGCVLPLSHKTLPSRWACCIPGLKQNKLHFAKKFTKPFRCCLRSGSLQCIRVFW